MGQCQKIHVKWMGRCAENPMEFDCAASECGTPSDGDPVEITNLVVARYLDGRVLKGITRDFSANRPMFHIEREGGEIVEMRTRQLKAIFFVRSFEGDPAREDVHGFVAGPAETNQGRKIAVRFHDDEFVCGYTLSWTPDRDGFFLFPADVGNNNQRIWIICAATKEIKAGPQAELLAERILAEQKEGKAPRGYPEAGGSPRAPESRPSVPHSRPMNRPSGIMPRPSGLSPKPSKRDDHAA